MCYTRRMDDCTPITVEEVRSPGDIPLLSEVALQPTSSAEIVDISPEKNTPEEPALPPLTPEQDLFALAMIECGGNVTAAARAVFGEDVKSPKARGTMLMSLPQVAARVADLSGSLREQVYISIGTHVQELAEIRDLAKAQGQLKVALQAERTRGEVTGLYDRFEHGSKDKGPTNIQINLVSKYDVNI